MNTSSDLFERWFPYWEWECLKNGMWLSRKNDMDIVKKCAALLSDPIACESAMLQAIDEYPISAKQHLSKSTGRRPWMGQAACCLALKATEEETRIAWCFNMTPAVQDKANEIADYVIAIWERSNA